jgi:hypothetical protein
VESIFTRSDFIEMQHTFLAHASKSLYKYYYINFRAIVLKIGQEFVRKVNEQCL